MKALLVLLMLVLLGAGAALLLFTTGRAPGGPMVSPAAGPGGGASAASAEAPALEPAPADPDVEGEAGPAAVSTTAVRAAVGDASRSFQPDPEGWTTVEVQLPSGHPVGESVEVWAFFGLASPERITAGVMHGGEIARLAALGGASDWARVEVSDGVAEVPVPTEATQVALVPVGRFLQPLPAVRALGEQGVDPPRLEPPLGACLELVLQLPAGAGEEYRDPTGFSYTIEVADDPGTTAILATLAGVGSAGGEELWHPDDELVHVVRGVAPDLRTAVMSRSERFVDPSPQVVTPAAGELQRLEFEPQWGGAVSIRVVDDQGAPAEGIDVNLNRQRMSGPFTEDSYRYASTPADGVLSFEGLQAGSWSANIRAQGLTAEMQTFEVVAQESVEREMVLSKGLVLTGRVEWPDGQPAVGANLDAMFEVQRNSGGNTSIQRSSNSTRSQDDGSFELAGTPLGATVHSLDARLNVPDEARAQGLGAFVGDVYRARLEDVDPDQELVLVLKPTEALVGRVVDQHGEPVKTKFTVVAWPVGGQRWGPDTTRKSFGEGVPEGLASGGPGSVAALALAEASAPSGHAHELKKPESDLEPGEFRLPGLFDGEWTVNVEAEGYFEFVPLQVQMPRSEPLEITLELGSQLTGLVVTPDGQPAPGARVAVVDDELPFRFDSGDGVEADASGRFVLLPETSTVEIWASHPDWASSETQLVAPGEVGREGITLTLRQGATVRGIVRQADGSPWAGRVVIATDLPMGMMMGGPMGGGPEEPFVTGSDGRFELTHVDPGKLTVVASLPQDEIERRMQEATEDMEQLMLEIMGEMLSERVSVADGETVEVELGAKPKRPVQITGRVLRGSQPVAGRIMVLAESGPPLIGARGATSGEDGSYELTVDNPGVYSFIVTQDGVNSQGENLVVSVPEVDQYSQDLSLTTSAIRGQVVGADGAGLGGVSLSLVPEDGANSALDVFMNGGVLSETGGAFEYPYVQPGTYTLRANVPSEPGEMSVRSDRGHAIRTGLRVGVDEVLDGIVLRLDEPGVLEGKVLEPDGTPVLGADVFAREASGRSVSILPSARSGPGGSYRIPGLAPGDYTLFARRDDRVTRDVRPISVSSGAAATQDLELAAGSYLVLLPELDGAPVRVRTSVVDEAGRDWGGLWSPEDLMTWMSEGSPMEEVRIGPLPGGRYTVRAATIDGASDSKKTVTVREGQDERRVKLRLK